MPTTGVNAGTERIDRAHKHEHQSLDSRIARLEKGLNTVAAIVPSPTASGGGPNVTGTVVITGSGGIDVTSSDGVHINISINEGTFAPPQGPGTGGGSGGNDAPGTIKMHNTAYAPIPGGWVICDGNNGTPDMIGKFPRGAAATAGSGGAATHFHHVTGTVNPSGATACTVQPLALAFSVNPAGHVHTFATDTDTASSLPPYTNVVFIMKT